MLWRGRLVLHPGRFPHNDGSGQHCAALHQHSGAMKIPPGLIDSSAVLRSGAGRDAIHRDFRAGKLVRIRRGFYVRTDEWNKAYPSDRFVWTTAAISRSVPDALLCGHTAALASGLPVLGIPASVDLATVQPGRSGLRKSPFLVLGDAPEAREARSKRSYPLRYCLKQQAEADPDVYGEFRCTGLLRTIIDVMVGGQLSQALVVADGAARKFQGDGAIAKNGNLLMVPGMEALIAALPFASARNRATRVALLANPLVESVGESYSRAIFEFLGFEQPTLQSSFWDSDGKIGRSDFFWKAQGVVGEFDGKDKYLNAARMSGITPEEALYREKLREDRIRALGYDVKRWAWADLQDPSRVKRKLLAAGLRPAGSSVPRLVRRSEPCRLGSADKPGKRAWAVCRQPGQVPPARDFSASRGFWVNTHTVGSLWVLTRCSRGQWCRS